METNWLEEMQAKRQAEEQVEIDAATVRLEAGERHEVITEGMSTMARHNFMYFHADQSELKGKKDGDCNVTQCQSLMPLCGTMEPKLGIANLVHLISIGHVEALTSGHCVYQKKIVNWLSLVKRWRDLHKMPNVHDILAIVISVTWKFQIHTIIPSELMGKL